MAPLIALTSVTLLARLVGELGVRYLDTWPEALAVGLAAMFLLTASAHVVRPARDGLIAIVPPGLPRPSLLVTATGVLEVVGALGLLVPPDVVPLLRGIAALGLAGLLIAMFPANVHAARERRHAHAPQTPLLRRTAFQVVYLAAAVLVAVASL